MRINPYTGEALPAFAPAAHADTLVETLRRRQETWRQLPIVQRAQLLVGALTTFEKEREAIANTITAEMGRPITQARREIDGLLERARYLAEIAPQVLAPEVVEEKLGFERAIVHEPHGVVLVIAAWNYPLLVTINGLMAALLAGNTVLLKHASQTLSIGEHFARAFGDLIAHAVMDHQTVAGLLSQRRVDHVIFTGSVEAGRSVYQEAARGLIDCHLELGGKDGAYVAADADPDEAADSLVDGAMFNSGQSCCGVERVYVHASLHERFLKRAQTLASEYLLGDPMHPSTTMGPLAQPNQADVLQAQVNDALEKGARLVSGGKARQIEKATFFEPTILADVTHDMTVMQEENFGPIMPVMKVEDDQEALRLLNACRYGLTAIIFTQDSDRARAFARDLQVGTVFQNRCDYLDPALPWTGVKDSGLGSALSKYGLLGVTRRKALHFKLP